MSFEIYESRFREIAKKAGYSEDNIQLCLRYARPLIEKNLPVLYNTSNLAAYVGYRKSYIKKAALYTPYFYRRFEIQKKNGQPRLLSEPLPSLKEIQHWILESVLTNVPVSKYAKAYIRDKDLLDNVKYHKKRDIVVNLDIENFFPSIKRKSIEEIFLKLGYSSNISNLLSKLCTCNDSLPQGAPTSPALSNIFMKVFDEAIADYCTQRNIRFTRYADDITLSGKMNVGTMIEVISNELKKLELSLNTQKNRISGKGDRQIVTGIIVNEIVQVPKEQRQKIRQEIYFIKKFGLKEHLQKTRNLKSNYLKHLLGKINFILFINPKDKAMVSYKKYVYSLIIENNS